ncbi:unnamed protein product [Spirodela intermedia]|uniref:AtC3H23-like CCCH zinc finger domain-containing protein n=1 Tax=Spirodela intermedia TaxID=51605 RepID=A0A7I8IHE9_SPIIN|nr:unnamed protein product [Spirodela intermedia]CAA6656493.1 unnamed protein product [Spirodela intermedia]
MAPQFPAPEGQALDESDEFRMYCFKIKRCSKTRSHDWTQCPYAHRGEKARRRDPASSHTMAKGQLCQFSHGVFEFWLHPARYRTRPCKAGMQCQRKVCFFAHTPEQLRPLGCGGCGCGGDWRPQRRCCGSGVGAVREEPSPSSSSSSFDRDCADVTEDIRRLEIAGDDVERGDESDLPDIDWICELVK